MKNKVSLKTNKKNQKYDILIGTGGIGSGMFVELKGNHTLGREESRAGRILNRRDYCKLHIISHYISVLLGQNFKAIPIGYVGEDTTGNHLIDEMKNAGIDTRFVKKLKNKQTLFSICFTYPDKSGGNITTDNSACSYVTPATITIAMPLLSKHKNRAIAMAVPEVPLPSRLKLLNIASRYGCFTAASFVSGEMLEVRKKNILKNVNYLAINIHEAAMLAGISDSMPAERIVAKAFLFLSKKYPFLLCSITAGKKGSWVMDANGNKSYCKPIPVKVISTAGAGDAFMSGMLTGIVMGLPLQECHELANIVSSLAVMSPHTINPGINRISIFNLVKKYKIKIGSKLRIALGG